MEQRNRLIIIAGGTGGHVFPGITVARYLMHQGWKVCWIGTSNHIEAELVPKNGINIEFISISGLRGNKIKALVLSLAYILNSCVRAYFIIKKFNPDVVLGMGGYVSGPGSLAAWLLRIPLVLHEQNCIAGLTNKWLSRIASNIMQAFPSAFPQAEVVGNPIRLDVLDLPHPKERLQGRKGPLRILVIGGSQGARILNYIMPKVAAKLRNMIKIKIWHQSGKVSKTLVEQAYSGIKCLQYKVTDFIENIAEAYSWADIVVCRAGALTVSEIAVAGLPALFIPFQHKDRQQYWNALPLEKVGAAKIFEEKYVTADEIAANIAVLDRKKLLDMAQRALSQSVRDATEKIAQKISFIAKSASYK